MSDEEYYNGPDIDFGQDAPPPPREYNDVVPTGYYKAVIVKKEYRQEEGKTPAFHLEVKLTDPEEFRCTAWDDLWLSKLERAMNKQGVMADSFNMARIKVLLAAFGRRIEGKMSLGQVFNMIPLDVGCVVRTELEDDGEYGEKVRFRYYYPADYIPKKPFGPTGEKPRPNKKKTVTGVNASFAAHPQDNPPMTDLGEDIILPDDEDHIAQ